ncbi:long-chain-alcohol O-fatty-acyltransferase-like [Salvia divinorum]|uniref:Long-chain-alcohol O-fatty-acyltransferase-like n=1 Tax=Salvia divinorum TaxID=28513 RepID=A0ABD1I2M6_SALDI
MDPEIQNFIAVWLTAAASLIYCHQIAARVPAGAARLLSLLPIMYLFTTLPLRLSSFHLGGPTIFYLVWLGNSKLLLFSFDQPPLSTTPPLSLLNFLSTALLPIKHTSSSPTIAKSSSKSKIPKIAIFVVKCGLLALIVSLYRYRDSINPYLIYALYCCHVYLGVELTLASTAAPVAALGLQLEPQFDEPYLATSLQDFWGRRWNLVAGGMLRATVYLPARRALGGGRRAAAAAVVATFAASGLMHELIYYYLSRVRPTWEVTWFFLLHGFLVAVEVGLKRASGGMWRLPTAVARPLTLGIVAVTGAWLFFPQVIRNGMDLKAIDEYYVVLRFLRKSFYSIQYE